MIIILIGPPGSGKTTIRERLEALGWAGFEASAYICQAKQRYAAATLAELTTKAGSSIAAKMISEELTNLPADQPTVISGFRSPNEINYLKAHAEVVVVGLYLNLRTAYNRIEHRQRPGDNVTFAEFARRVEADYDLGVANILYHHTDIYMNTDRNIDAIAQDLQRVKPTPTPIRQTQSTFNFPDRIAIAPLPRI